MSDYWFKPKTHGYGAYPANWKGWAAIIVLLALALALVWFILLRPLIAGRVPSVGEFLGFLVADTVLILAFLWLARAKTDGDWRWRWGKN